MIHRGHGIIYRDIETQLQLAACAQFAGRTTAGQRFRWRTRVNNAYSVSMFPEMLALQQIKR